MYMSLVFGSKLTSSLFKWSKMTRFSLNQNYFRFRVGRYAKHTCFLSGDRNWLDFDVGVKVYLVLGWGRNWLVFMRRSKLTLFSCARRKYLFFYFEHGNWLGSCDSYRDWLDLSVGGRTRPILSVGMIYILVIVWVVEIDLFLVCQAEKYLYLDWAWKLTWFLCCRSKRIWYQCGRSNMTWFQYGDVIDLMGVWVVKIDLVVERGAKITCFNVSMQIDLYFMWVVQIDLILVWEVELDLISG